MAFIKGLVPGLLLTFVLAGILGSNGQSAGWLEVHSFAVEQVKGYWSWPLFVVSTGLGWGIFAMLD